MDWGTTYTRLFQSRSCPILDYGSEIWGYTSFNKIDAIHAIGGYADNFNWGGGFGNLFQFGVVVVTYFNLGRGEGQKVPHGP